ncbi:Basal-body rod modification protein FlgD (modular protein) [uncultured delta proteobacterium]|uniref:Basal-body rod modification protein FlgD n=1 Tax=uncultured delta proteobacterium TaxID=34034 RepID=A0A212KCK3_9DELT|nr:Basal-body rod modification protein FlgD (modular protein) [uncultured delta proteobacterium]
MAATTNIMANSNIWTSSADNAATSGKTDRLASDKHTFLKLLVAQLTNQDPLNPTEDKEFVAQLAQFTSLEQLQEINAGVEGLNTTMTQSQLMTATGFIGKNVIAKGDQITKLTMSGQIVTTQSWFTITDPATKAQATILDSSGMPVFSEELGSFQAGTHRYAWNGKLASGQEAPNGVYSIMITAQDKNDKTVVIQQQQLSARVVGVENVDGVYKLILDGGRTVNLMDVTEITLPDESTGTVSTYSGLAADAAASAALAKDNAEVFAQKALGSTVATDAKKYAESSINAAATARESATAARKIADNARKEAESLKTADALNEYTKTDEQAKKAEAYATQAEEFAADAKGYAESLGADFTE